MIADAFTNRRRRRRRYRPNASAGDTVALIEDDRRGALRQFLLTDALRATDDSDDSDFEPGTPEQVSEESQDGVTESEAESDSD